MTTKKELRDGEPCAHPGCLHHVTHPCEGCGRLGGRRIKKRVKKIIVGSVVQEWDEEKECFVSQEFIAAAFDDVTYEDEDGEQYSSWYGGKLGESYLPMEMVQPPAPTAEDSELPSHELGHEDCQTLKLCLEKAAKDNNHILQNIPMKELYETMAKTEADNSYGIKKLINEKYLEETVEKNSDAYGRAVVKVSINVMRHLDTFEGDFNLGYAPDMTTTHGIICECDDQGGITGFMASCARNIACVCHELGWKFYLADAISVYEVDSLEHHEKLIESLLKLEELSVSEDEIREYIKGLVERYKTSKLKSFTPIDYLPGC